MSALDDAVDKMAAALKGIDTGGLYCQFTCSEIDAIQLVLALNGNVDEAIFIIHEHAVGDDDPSDEHYLLGRAIDGEDCPLCGFTHSHIHI